MVNHFIKVTEVAVIVVFRFCGFAVESLYVPRSSSDVAVKERKETSQSSKLDGGI